MIKIIRAIVIFTGISLMNALVLVRSMVIKANNKKNEFSSILRRSSRLSGGGNSHTAKINSFCTRKEEQQEETNDGSISSSSSSVSDSFHALKTKTPKKRKRSSTIPKYEIYSNNLENINPNNKWIDLNISPEELRPSTCLTTGQCFNWRAVLTTSAKDSASLSSASAWGTHDATEWIGIIGRQVFLIRETPSTTLCRLLSSSTSTTSTSSIKSLFYSYFQLSINISALYKKWSDLESNRFKRIAACIPGYRHVQQDPLECFVSFLCSSNNNIPRITYMIDCIREHHGDFIMSIPVNNLTEQKQELKLYAFPTLDQLLQVNETELRSLGLGYRAKYIRESLTKLQSLGGTEYLYSLRKNDDAQYIQSSLTQFTGIGLKVADCIALFSLNVATAIPVDVHVWNIAQRDYNFELRQVKSLTPTVYHSVGDLFRDIFKAFPGWAHSILFVAELPSFKNVLPPDIIQEMEKFKQEELERKKKKKQES